MSANEYTVRIRPHDRTIHVRAGQPVLEAALAAGLNLPHSCKSGHCSSCRALLRAGEIRYPGGRPAGLTAEEERTGHVLLCQARALSDQGMAHFRNGAYDLAIEAFRKSYDLLPAPAL